MLPLACGLGQHFQDLSQFFTIQTSQPANNIIICRYFIQCFNINCEKCLKNPETPIVIIIIIIIIINILNFVENQKSENYSKEC